MERKAVWMRRAGLGLGTAASAFWLFAVIVGLVGPGTSWSLEAVLLAALVAFGSLALIASWQWQAIGSLLLLVDGLALAAFAGIVAGHNRVLIAILLGGPFVLSGTLLRFGLTRARGTSLPLPGAQARALEPDSSRGTDYGDSG